MNQPPLTHEYLLHILNQQQMPEKKISAKVHNPVFNLNNSNINFNLNI